MNRQYDFLLSLKLQHEIAEFNYQKISTAEDILKGLSAILAVTTVSVTSHELVIINVQTIGWGILIWSTYIMYFLKVLNQ